MLAARHAAERMQRCWATPAAFSIDHLRASLQARHMLDTDSCNNTTCFSIHCQCVYHFVIFQPKSKDLSGYITKNQIA